VCDALAPFARTPVSKLWSLAVAVCELGPALVQVTVSPAWIVSEPGENLKSEIVAPGSRAECAFSARGMRKRWCRPGCARRASRWRWCPARDRCGVAACEPAALGWLVPVEDVPVGDVPVDEARAGEVPVDDVPVEPGLPGVVRVCAGGLAAW
jgi:hypothetical protein